MDFVRLLLIRLSDSALKIYMMKNSILCGIFEYLIKDYNIDSGGKYAEYFTPHAVAKIMALFS